jgi:hypothetical protein
LSAAIADRRRSSLVQGEPAPTPHIRKPLDESEGFGAAWIIIKQLRPGLRVRFAVDITPGITPTDDERTAVRLFEQAVQFDPAKSILRQTLLAFDEAEGRA